MYIIWVFDIDILSRRLSSSLVLYELVVVGFVPNLRKDVLNSFRLGRRQRVWLDVI